MAGKSWSGMRLNVTLVTLPAMLMILPANQMALAQTAQKKPAMPMSAGKMFTWNSGPEGWEGTNDFRLDRKFKKLGGPIDKNAWVTECPRNHSTYTEGAYADSEGYPKKYPGPNLLISPWFDLSGLKQTGALISFQQSISVEAGWDGSWMEYTTDGSHWKHLGKLNDSNGTNWYSTKTYKNAQSRLGDPPDTSTLKLPSYELYGPSAPAAALPLAWWTSDGNPDVSALPEGPFGWIHCSLKITPSEYPDIFNAHAVQLRYVAFSDAVNPRPDSKKNPIQGWAIDNFSIEPANSVRTH